MMISVICGLIVLISCKRGSGEGDDLLLTLGLLGAKPIPVYVDVSSAKALMVLPASAGFRASDAPAALSSGTKDGEYSASWAGPSTGLAFYKIAGDNTIVRVGMSDASGNPISDAVPSAIYDAGVNYLIMIIDGSPYLVNKTTGETYQLNEVGKPDILHYGPQQSVFVDASQNIYYLSRGRVKKIDVSNPARITAVNATVDVDDVSSFTVGSDGTLLYSIYGGIRVKKTNGGLYNLPDPGSRFYYRGLDGALYFQNSNSGSIIINRINVDGSYNVTMNPYGSTANISGFIYYGYQYDWLFFPDRLIMICDTSIEVYNPTSQPRKLDFPFLAFSKRKIVKNSLDYYYVATKQGSIIRVNPVNDQYGTLLGEGLYDIYKMEVANDNVVFFNALRMADGKKVIGSIQPDGTLEIVDDTLTEDVIILQKVN